MELRFGSISNVRDLGGIPAADGRTVRPGLLLRGAKLDAASDEDLAKLGALHLRHIVDFRDPDERVRRPDRAVPGAEHHALPALDVLPGMTGTQEAAPDFDAVFSQVYADLAASEAAAAAYRAFFRILLERDGPVYWHCTQGKDRTGVAALLLLDALGAPQEAALADYYASNAGLAAERARTEEQMAGRWPPETLDTLFTVSPRFLGIWQRAIGDRFGGVRGYLTDRLGVTAAEIAALRAHYLV